MEFTKLQELVEGLDHPLTGEKQRWADKHGRDINPSAAKKAIVAAKTDTAGKHYPEHVKAWAKSFKAHLESIGKENVKFKDEGDSIGAFSGTERLGTYELDYREARYTNPKYDPAAKV